MTTVTVTFDFGDKPQERRIGPEEFRKAYEELWNTTFACDEWVGSRRRAIEAAERLMRGPV